jgi:formylglycine-generating enzyme
MPQPSRVRPPQPKEISESTKVSQILPPLMMSAQEKLKEAERQRKRSENYKKYAQNRSLRGGVEFHLNLVPAGSFTMGRDEGDDVMRPRHPVKISRPYFIGTTQVTQKLFERVMRERRGKFSGEDRPVDSVSWNDAIDFCNRLSAVEGLDQAYKIGPKGLSWNQSSNGYRLPTEAEWEYAAYAGVPFLFAGSDDLDEVGWYRENSDQETHDVMQKKPNPWGLYDFSGNVWEWCYDLFKDDAYHNRGVEDTVDPVVDGEGPRVIKGGSWSYEAEGLEVSYRSRLATHFKTSRIGFRIARTPKLKKV